MKRLFAFLIFVAVAAALGYWVQTRHGGNLHRAWLQVVATVTVPFRSGPAETTAGTRPGGGEAQRARGGQGQGPAIAVVTAIAERADLPITRTSVGWVEPIATVTVRPRIDGQILEQYVKDGQMVKEGDILFRLDDREIQAQIARDQATLTRDQAMLAKTQADLRRAQELLSKNVGSPVQAEQIAADVKMASANVAASEAALAADRIRLGYTTIKAPIAGRVGVVRVTEGNLVRGSDAGGDGLATITQMQPLRVTFSLPERDLDLLREVMSRAEPAAVRVLPSGRDEVIATGKLSFVDSSVDQTSGTITAKAVFPNEDGRLWPGQYVRVEVVLGTRRNVTTVPLVAIPPGQDGAYAFIVKPDKTVERRAVEVAATYGETAAIESGVVLGEHVVIEGQLRLRNGSRVNETVQGGPAARRTAEAGAEQGAAR